MVGTAGNIVAGGAEEIAQQDISAIECKVQWDCAKGGVSAEETPCAGQQVWREVEGSGLEAGEAPACTIAAAREFMPGQDAEGRLTDQTISTISTIPRDRLSMTVQLCRDMEWRDVT